MVSYRVERTHGAQQMPTRSEHPDYKTNLENANRFIEKTKKSLLNGMTVKVCGGEHIPKALLMVSWSPPKEAPIGNCATPISLHQTTSSVNKQIEGIFSVYMRCVGDYQNKHPQQKELLSVSAIKV